MSTILLLRMAYGTRLSLCCKKLVLPATSYRCFSICAMHHGWPGKQQSYSSVKHNNPTNIHYSPSVVFLSTSNHSSFREKEMSDISQETRSKSSLVIGEGFFQLWKDFVTRLGKMTRRSNPILDDISELMMGTTDRSTFYPRFHDIKPHHFVDAFEVLHSQTQTLHQEMEDTFRTILIQGSAEDDNNQVLIDDLSIHGLPLEDSVLQNLYRIHFPTNYLRNLLGLYMQVNQVTIARRDRTLLHKLQMVQLKLGYYNATLTPTNTSLLYFTMEHVREKQSQLLPRNPSLQRQKAHDEFEKRRRALELILERENTVCATDDISTEQQLDNHDQSRQLQSENNEETNELQILKTLKQLSFQIKRREYQGSPQQEQQQYYASALTNIYQLLRQRKQKANTLGYESYTHLFLSKNMMIKKCADITAIHSSIAERAIPIVLQSQERWINEEEERNQKVTNVSGRGTFAASSYPKPAVWDKLSVYLELETVLQGMFDLTHRLFGIVIKEDTTVKRHHTWDRDVRIFQLYDEDNDMKYLASFYLDPYQRPDCKILGSNMCVSLVDNTIQSHTKTILAATESSSSTASSGTAGTTTIRTSPLVCILCDIQPADWSDSPCLLSFEDAINLFHEFGHALHQMLTKVDVGFVSGTNGVELDAVEFPSQFLPLWLYDKDTLISIGKHFQTGDKIPDELYDELTNERLLRSPLRILNQIFQGQLELELYDAKTDHQSVLQILEECSSRFALPKNQDTKDKKYKDLSQILDLFVDGTPEFRYRYLISEIMSCDAFAAFQEASLRNDASVSVLGRKFRDTILATGGGLEASEVFRRFRGRKFQNEAFLKHNGLL